MLLFEYMGEHGFNKVPVVISNYQIELPNSVDYVPVKLPGETEEGATTFVPTKCNIVVNLMPTYTPHKLRRRFDLDAIRTGKMYKDGFI